MPQRIPLALSLGSSLLHPPPAHSGFLTPRTVVVRKPAAEEDVMLRRDIFRAGLAGAAGLFGLRQASAATGEDRLKVAYHLSDADRVNFVLGNIKNHYEGTGGNVEIVLVVHGPALAA